MRFNINTLKWLFPVFDRMHHNCLKAELVKRGLREASNPKILFILKREMENMSASQKELADAIGISAPTIAISIKRMKKAGLVVQVSDENDARRNLITLTEKGLKFVEKCESAFNDVDRGMLQGFTDEECEQLKLFYIRMIHNLEAMGVQPPIQFKKECKKRDEDQ